MALATFSVIIFFAGMRTHVADTTAYIKMFNDYPLFSEARDVIFDSSARELGFRLFSILIKTYIIFLHHSTQRETEKFLLNIYLILRELMNLKISKKPSRTPLFL